MRLSGPLGPRAAFALVLIETAALFAIAWSAIERASFWVDEVRSLQLARDLAAMGRFFRTEEANMWLYYALLHPWISAFGESEAAVRSLSAVFAAASVPLIYAIGARLFDRVHGVAAGMIFAVHGFAIHYAREARGYAMLVFLIAAATYAFVAAIQKKSTRAFLMWSLLGAAAIYVHFFAAIALAAHVASVFALPRSERPVKSLALSCAVLTALVLPILYFAPLGSGQLAWIEPFTWKQLTAVLYALGGRHPIVAAILLVLAGAALFGSRRDPSWPRALLFLGVVLPIAAMFALSVSVQPVMIPRYAIITLPSLALFAALGIMKIKRQAVAAAVAGALILASARGPGSSFAGEEDWRGTAAYLVEHGGPRDAVIVFAYFMRAPLDLYLARDPRASERLELVEIASAPYATSGGTELPDPDVAAIERLADRYDRVWFIASHTGFGHIHRVAQRKMIEETLAKRFELVHTKRRPGIELTLYRGGR